MSVRRFAWLTAQAAAMVATMVILLGSTAPAGDYSITYAIDANGQTDAGKTGTCEYHRICEITALGLRLMFDVYRPDHRSAELTIDGPNGCCYSVDANDKFYLGIEPGVQKVALYAGRRRMGNEFVRNKRFGILCLELS